MCVYVGLWVCVWVCVVVGVCPCECVCVSVWVCVCVRHSSVIGQHCRQSYETVHHQRRTWQILKYNCHLNFLTRANYEANYEVKLLVSAHMLNSELLSIQWRLAKSQLMFVVHCLPYKTDKTDRNDAKQERPRIESTWIDGRCDLFCDSTVYC